MTENTLLTTFGGRDVLSRRGDVGLRQSATTDLGTVFKLAGLPAGPQKMVFWGAHGDGYAPWTVGVRRLYMGRSR